MYGTVDKAFIHSTEIGLSKMSNVHLGIYRVCNDFDPENNSRLRASTFYIHHLLNYCANPRAF